MQESATTARLTVNSLLLWKPIWKSGKPNFNFPLARAHNGTALPARYQVSYRYRRLRFACCYTVLAPCVPAFLSVTSACLPFVLWLVLPGVRHWFSPGSGFSQTLLMLQRYEK